MPPKYGLPLAALFTIGVLVVLGALWTVVSPARVERARRNWRRPGSKTTLVVGVLSASLSLSGAAVYGGEEAGRPFWFYVGYWVFLVVIPISLALWRFARWAKRTRPDEWAAAVEGVEWSELSPAMHRGYLAVIAAGLLPTLIVGAVIILRT
jgi:hypothetical protein